MDKVKKVKKKYSSVGVGDKTYRMFLRVSKQLKKESKSEVIKYLIEDFKVKKTQEKFEYFLKDYSDPPDCLERSDKISGSISFKEDQNLFIEDIMRDFNFWNKSRFFHYIIYYHYKNSFEDFEKVLSGEKRLILIPKDVAFKKYGRRYRRRSL